MPRKADEGVIPGRLVTEENAARRRPGVAQRAKVGGRGTSATRTTHTLVSQ
ncbi:MAG: hypothetical protein R2719_09200 [Micropruina sp.]